MRHLAFVVAVSALGCASTVARLDGEIPTPAGPARDGCEKRTWLVIGRTRTEYVPKGSRTAQHRDDGVGLYRVGGRHPEDVLALEEELGFTPLLAPHREGVSDYDRDSWIAAGLGTAGLIAIGIGSYLFVDGFETKRVPRADGTTDEKTEATDRVGIGAGIVGLGFALGITGIVLTPALGERAEAQSYRYAFLPGRDDLGQVNALVEKHNREARERCGGEAGGSGEEAPAAAPEAATSASPADPPAP
ncbi:MAG: hypothetical protein IT376_01815 [Polyangiaceae bacterium]|nr:hypothetical protein [Polyangiaceae bacterium]